MSRMGQCPSCRVVYELDDDAIGSVLPCECGVALFVCDVVGFSEIPVYCTKCEGEYVVDSEGAGEVVECECGQQLTVPTVVLRQPLASPGANPETLLSGQDEPPKHSDFIIDCPRCGAQYSLGRDDIGDEAECRCGAVFVISLSPEGTLLRGRRSQRRQAVTIKRVKMKAKRPQRRKKPISLVSILGCAAVGLLLLIDHHVRDARSENESRPPHQGQIPTNQQRSPWISCTRRTCNAASIFISWQVFLSAARDEAHPTAKQRRCRRLYADPRSRPGKQPRRFTAQSNVAVVLRRRPKSRYRNRSRLCERSADHRGSKPRTDFRACLRGSISGL